MGFFYYFGIALISIGIGIFNFSINSEGKDLQCYQITNMDQATYDSFKASGDGTGPAVVTIVENGVTTYEVPVSGSNSYTLFAMIIAILYLIIGGICFLLCLVMLWLSDMVPDDFLNIGWFKKFTAVTTKLFPPLLVIVHWVCGLMIVVFWIILTMKGCEVSEPAVSTFGFNSLKFHSQCQTLQIVNSCVFILLHCVAALVKDMKYIEPFMYAPIIGEPNPVLDFMLKTAGP
mmetsp:Transcript_26481/g.27528  ORF Transcript_26481/g.27528 Transcript_26481/m.27528 type:complete len:232 (+) Transcript_26481:4-699(+)